MTRNLTNDVVTEVTKTEVRPTILAELDFISGFVRLWTGVGDLSWASSIWNGVGDLSRISTVQETDEVRANGITLQLSGIPSSLIATALLEQYQGRSVRLWLGFLDSAGAIIADPIPIFAGRMDVMQITESDETATIQVSVESRLIDLDRSRERRYTHEDQQIDFPGDLGLQYVAGLQDQHIVWGG